MKIDIIRAWKDETYRQQLSGEEQALLPANPAGELQLSDAELQSVYGAQGPPNNFNSFALICVQSVAGTCISFSNHC